MADSPYFTGANSNIDEAKKGMLDAVASAGTAGKQAFEQAQQGIAANKQEAVQRAATRAALFGAGGNDQTFTGAYDTRLGQLGTNRAGFESGLAQTGASNASYLEKARASIPALQTINAGKASAQEATIKAAIAAAQQRADAAAAAEAAKEQAAIDRENRADARATMRESRADARASARATTAAAAKAPKLPKFEDLTGEAEHQQATAGPGRGIDITNDMVMTAQDRAAFNKTDPSIELSRIIGQAYGLTPGQVNAIMTPQKVNQYLGATSKLTAPPPPPMDAKALATKYATKGVTPALAQSVLGNVDYQHDVNWLLGGADGKSRDEVDKILRKYYVTDRGWNAEYNVLAGEYLPRIPA